MVQEILQQASFRGVPFLAIGNQRTQGGRKGVTHEYPNTNKRFFEDLGTFEEIYNVPGIISGTGQDYIQRRDNLRTALKTGGTGILVHPFYGSKNVSIKTFTVNESFKELGVARFSMTFEQSEEVIFPRESGNNIATISNQATTTRNSIASDLATIFEIPVNSALNFSDASNKLEDVVNIFSIDNTAIAIDQESLDQFRANLDSFSLNANSNIFDPDSLSVDLFALFDEFELLATNPRDQLKILANLFVYGDDDDEILLTTLSRIQRNTNRTILNSSIRTQSLVQSYNTITDVSFTTSDDLNDFRASLEGQYQTVIADNNLASSTLQDVQELRNQVRIFLDDELLNVYKIADINTKEIPMTVLAYQYYGDFDKTQDLINLNMSRNVAFVEGDVKILTV